jgi:5-hydroxyisourate hydrolase
VSTLSTHVLDTGLGRPVAGIRVILSRANEELCSVTTDSDGRAKDLQGKTPLTPGRYRLTFAVGAYFAANGRETFYDVVVIEFKVGEGSEHYHVPLLLSPYGYSTYRGS